MVLPTETTSFFKLWLELWNVLYLHFCEWTLYYQQATASVLTLTKTPTLNQIPNLNPNTSIGRILTIFRPFFRTLLDKVCGPWHQVSMGRFTHKSVKPTRSLSVAIQKSSFLLLKTQYLHMNKFRKVTAIQWSSSQPWTSRGEYLMKYNTIQQKNRDRKSAPRTQRKRSFAENMKQKIPVTAFIHGASRPWPTLIGRTKMRLREIEVQSEVGRRGWKRSQGRRWGCRTGSSTSSPLICHRERGDMTRGSRLRSTSAMTRLGVLVASCFTASFSRRPVTHTSYSFSISTTRRVHFRVPFCNDDVAWQLDRRAQHDRELRWFCERFL